jgi:hypothetical protein
MAYDDTLPGAARASRRGRVVNYAGLFRLALVALRNKMAKHPGALRLPDGIAAATCVVANGKARPAPGVPGHDLCPVHLRKRMMRIVNRRRLSCVCGGTWPCSARLEIRGLHS